ncbi:MAG: T9SS type A sorting domain-containing protein [Bacteroidia bacterium]|jgi:hypothetical protein|nr:T9SS type A sorting domain-containing protein [Bacteroidia bacterium]
MVKFLQTIVKITFILTVIVSGFKASAQTNHALTATATHSGGGNPALGFGPANYNDGIINPFNCAPTPCGWGWINTNANIEYTWAAPVTFNKIVFYKDNRPFTSAVIEIWNGTSYVALSPNPFLSPIPQVDSITFALPITTTRLRFNNVQGTNPNFREIQVIQLASGSNNAATLAIDTPLAFSTGSNLFTARIRNSGTNQITSVNVNWEVNGVAQTPINFTGLIDTLGGIGSNVQSIQLGNFTFANNTLYRVKVFTSLPNNTPDTVNIDDTATAIYRSPLNGTFTVGPGGDFITISEAAQAASRFGLNGPVTFTLIGTNYNTANGETYPISFANIPGASSTNTVTIKPASGNSPLIEGNTTTMFVLSGANWLIVNGSNSAANTRDLTIKNYNTAGVIFNLSNDARNNQLINMNLLSANTGTASGTITISGSTGISGNDNNLIQNNYFGRSAAGAFAVGIISTGQSNVVQNDNNTIIGNEFNSFTFNGINVAATNNGSNWLIANNIFYDTALNTTQVATWSAINFVPGTSSNSTGNQILNNIIGGNSALALGGALNNNTAIARTAILVSTANGTATRVYGNQVKNWVLGSTTATGTFTAISATAGTSIIDSNLVDNILSLNNAVVIGINASAASDYTISRNTVQNISAYNTGTTNAIRAISTSAGLNVLIQNNTVKNLKTNSGNTGSTTGASLIGINSASTSNTITISGNTIGTFAEPLTNNNTSANAVRITGILSTSGISVIENNTIDGLFQDSTACSALGSSTLAAINGILVSSSTAGQVIRNNTIRHLYQRSNQTTQTTQINGICYASSGFTTISANTIYGLFSRSSNTSTSTSSAINGINFSSSGVSSILNNYIDSISLQSVTISTSQINGIVVSGAAGNRVAGNQIKSMYNRFTTTAPGICGIQYVSSVINQECDSNIIWGLYNLHTATTGSIIGIRYTSSSATSSNVSFCNRNFIHSFASASTTATNLIGIDLSTAAATTANNLIRLGIDTAGVPFSGPFVVSGINNTHSSSTFASRIFHNTVYIDGAPTSGTSITAAYRSSIGFISWSEIRNNIFVNLVQNAGGTGNNFAINYGSIPSTPLFTCNNNIYWVGSGLTGNFLAGGFTNVATLSGNNSLKSVYGRDVNSIHANPNLIAPTGAAGTINLNLPSSNPAEGIGGAIVLGGVSNDFNGTQRLSATPVDIGAYASATNTLSFDSAAPEISYTALLNTASIQNRTIIATIRDLNSGIAAGTFVPKLYFNKNNGQWFTTNGTQQSGNSKEGTWEFTIDYSLIGGVVPNDIIRYFVAAQDSSGNYSTLPTYGIGADITQITTHTTPNQYSISTPIATSITVGPTGTYPNLTGPTGLFNAINNSLLQGNTEVLLEDGATIVENGNIGLNQWLEFNGVTTGNFGYTLTIRPAGLNQTILAGTVNTTDGLLRLNGADRVRILGYAVGGSINDTDLIIRNTSTSQPALTILNDAVNIFIQGVIFESNNTGTAITSGGALRISPTSVVTGNDNIYIGNSVFRKTLGTTSIPGILLAASGTTGVNRENDNILIENSTFYGMNLNSIWFATGNGNNIRIKNNTFFYDSTSVHTLTSTVINFTPGAVSNNDTISENIIGGSGYGLTGLWRINNALSLTGISVSSGTNTGTYISNNRIANILMSNTGSTSFTGILVNTSGGIATIAGNYIGDTLNPTSIQHFGTSGTLLGISCQTNSASIINNNIVSGIINSATTSNTTVINGIRSWNQTATLQIANNLISNLLDSSSSASTSSSAAMIGINVSSSTTSIAITGNTIRNLANIVTATSTIQTLGIVTNAGLANLSNNVVESIRSNAQNTSTTTSSGLIGIWNASTTPGQIITNNTVRFLNYTTLTPNSTQLIGIMQSSGSGHTINNNLVHNLFSNTISSNTTTLSGIIGIMHNGSGSQITMNGNTVFGLEGAGLTGNTSIVGMLYQGTTTNVLNSVARNFVHSFKLATIGNGRMIGIQQNSGSFTRYSNNMIRLGIDSAGTVNTGNYEVYGFLNDVSGNFEYYHNTVYLGGNPTSGAAITACIRLNGTPTGVNINDLRNNVFVNATTNGGAATGKHFAIRLAAFPASSTSVVSNYNLLLANGTGGIIGGTNTLDFVTLGGLSGWARNSGYDLQSASTNPLLIDPTGSAATLDLHLQNANPLEGSGDQSLIGVVTVDFDGNTRTGIAGMDVGADAANFTLASDAFPPSITYTPVNNQGNLIGPLTISNVNIRDNVGSPLLPAPNAPRIYYKKGTLGTWVSNQASSATGTPTNANYTFEIFYGSFGGVTTGDTIYYYIAAEDSAGGNLTSQRPLAIGLNINSISNEPATTDFYTLLPTIPAGSKFYVGNGQPYSTLTGTGGLFEFLNNNTLGGSVTAVITSNIVEPGTVGLNQLGEDGVGAGSYTITIRPDSSATSSRIISGNSNSGLIRLNGADRIKIIGIPDQSTNNNLNLLTIRSSSTISPAVLFTNGSTQCRLHNLTIESANLTTPLGINGGVISFASSTVAPIGNSQDSITNCTIRNDQSLTFPNGVPASLISSFHSGTILNSNNVITGCNFLNASSVYLNVDAGSGNGWIVTNNSFYNTLPIITANPVVVRFNGAAVSDGHTINNNFIGGTLPQAAGSSWTSNVAAAWNCIQLAVGNNTTTQVTGNTIRNIRFTQSASAIQFNGILVTAGRTNISSNMIGDSTVVGSIELAPPTTHSGIAVNATVTVQTTINNNRFAGIAVNSPGNAATLLCINVAGGITTISNNIIGAVGTANSITNNANAITRGINVTTAVNVDPATQITGNTICNINALNNQTGVSLGGIFMSGSTVANISNNRIFNLTTTSSNTTLSGINVAVFGISLSGSTNAGPVISNNIIYSLTASNNGSVITNAAGVLVQSANAPQISANRIYDIRNLSTSTSLSPTPTANGLVIFNVVNLANVINNQITLGQAQTNNVQFNGIWLPLNSVFDVNAYYNTVLITGNVSSGSLTSFAFHRGSNSTTEVTASIRLVNNAFINHRAGGSSKNYAIANELSGTASGGGWLLSNYNLLSSSSTTTVGLWGSNDLNMNDWRSNTNGDRNSWSAISSLVNPTALFIDIPNGNLNANVNASQNWYLHGKGIAGATSANINTDFNGNTRGTVLGYGTNIGAHEFNSLSTPPAANIVGTPALNGTSVISFGERTLATITWGNSGTVPSAIAANYFSGLTPPNVFFGANYMDMYLQINATGGSNYNYQMVLNYDPALLGSVSSENNLRIARWNAIWSYDFLSTPNTGASTIASNFASNQFGSFTGTDITAPLPVALLNFNGKRIGKDASLFWTTTFERNNSGFIVERSADGMKFEYAGFVKGSLNSSVSRSYSFVDKEVFTTNPVYYYRLKQVDIDGNYEYSSTIQLSDTETEQNSSLVYPNPFSDNLSLTLRTVSEGSTNIEVFDMNGRIVFNKTVEVSTGINEITLNELTSFERGVYFVKITHQQFSQTHKVVHIK